MKNTRALKMFAALLLLTAVSAYAQTTTSGTFDTAKSAFEKIKTWLDLISVVVISLAIIFVGFRMAFQAAQWKDVAPVFWGACLIGAATALAGLLLGHS